MGELLGRVVERNLPTSGLMISALVVYLNANDAGSDFYALAQELGMLPKNATSRMKDAFWIQQVAGLHEFYGRRSARSGTRPAEPAPRT